MQSRSSPRTVPLARIVSGGQTGVDRAALDAAIAFCIPHGGWCPKGRLAEDGAIPSRYCLEETETSDYPERTERNVVDSDGTLILYRGMLFGGTELTRKLATRHRRPHLTLDIGDPSMDVDAVRRWLLEHRIRVLNVAGPRESSSPGIGAAAYDFLQRLLARET